MDNDKKVDACLLLYRQQMEHYHKTQEVEWKGTFGAWTLGAAAIAWGPAASGQCWPLLILLLPIVHGLWLAKIHKSEEYDKFLWARYRHEACLLLDLASEPYQRREGFKGRVASPGSWSHLHPFCGVPGADVVH